MSWIKMRTGLRRHPKVVRMAAVLKADRLRVIGAIHAVWSVFDEHSPDGLLEGYTLALMDDEIGWRGFSAAMQSIGWLTESESGLQAPDYEEHNGPTAKRRASETKRVAKNREGDKTANGSWTPSGQMSAFSPPENVADSVLGGVQMYASDADKPRTRVELDKRREEVPTVLRESARARPPPKPDGVPDQVWADWTALRKAKRAPVTATVIAEAQSEAGKAGMTLEAFLREWCVRGSQGLKAEWLAPRPGATAPPPIDTAARNAESRRLLGFAPIPPTEPSGEIIDA